MSTNEPSSPETKPKDTSPASESTATPETTSFGGWFSSIVQSAKDTVNKSAGTFENIKRDFNEFKDAVQNDATSMVYSTASIVKNKLEEIGNTVNEISSLGTDEIEPESEVIEPPKEEKRLEQASLNEASCGNHDEDDADLENPFNLETINAWTSLLTDRAKSTINMVKETLVDSIFINREFLIDELNEEPYVIKDGQIVPIKNWKEMLHNLQINPDTYCREPSGPPEEFDLWLTKFNLINYQKQMEYLLDNVPEILKMHINLVPKELSESCFWHRYYYRVHQLKEEQKRLILQSNNETNASVEETTTTTTAESNSVNIKYLSEKSSQISEGSQADNDSKISRSSTEDWEKMTDADSVAASKTPEVDKSSSDEDRDWVKCD